MKTWKVFYINDEGNQYGVFIDANDETDALKKFYEHKPWTCEMVVGVEVHDWRKSNNEKKLDKDEQIALLKSISKKCDLIINNEKYNPDAFTQCVVEDIGEMCEHALDILQKGYTD